MARADSGKGFQAMRYVSRRAVAVMACIMILTLSFTASADSGSGAFRRRGSSPAKKESSVEITEEMIKTVQEQLNELGFDCGTPDGIAGSKTMEAVREFQESYGLSVHGVIDATFVEDLNEVIEQRSNEETVEQNSSEKTSEGTGSFDQSDILNAEKQDKTDGINPAIRKTQRFSKSYGKD